MGVFIILSLLSFFGVNDSMIVAHDTADPQPISGTIQIGEVEITHLSNAGFFFMCGEKKILIDALFRREEIPAEISLAVFGKIQKGLPPFDGIDMALATHAHGDHFDPYSAGKFLENNPEAIFISHNEARLLFEQEFSGFDEIQDRVVTVTLEKGETTELTENGIKLRILGMRHGGFYTGKNYGYLFEMGGLKILHMGDSLLTLSEIEVFQLSQEKIDVVFINWWYLIDNKYVETVREGIQAKQVVVMHNELKNFEDKTVDIDWVLERVEAEFPDAIVFYGVPEVKEEPPGEKSLEEGTMEEGLPPEKSSEEARTEEKGYFLIIPVLIISAAIVMILLKKR